MVWAWVMWISFTFKGWNGLWLLNSSLPQVRHRQVYVTKLRLIERSLESGFPELDKARSWPWSLWLCFRNILLGRLWHPSASYMSSFPVMVCACPSRHSALLMYTSFELWCSRWGEGHNSVIYSEYTQGLHISSSSLEWQDKRSRRNTGRIWSWIRKVHEISETRIYIQAYIVAFRLIHSLNY